MSDPCYLGVVNEIVHRLFGVVRVMSKRDHVDASLQVDVLAIDGRRRTWAFPDFELRLDPTACFGRLKAEVLAWTSAMDTPEAYGLEDDHTEATS